MANVLLQPDVQDRAGAHTTVSLMEYVRQLKQIHGTYLSGNTSSWVMWANPIHSEPSHKQSSMINDLPPPHLVHLFRSVPTAEGEVLRAAQNGLQVVGNVNDILREKHIAGNRANWTETEVKEDMLQANSRMVSAMSSSLKVEVNSTSLAEEKIVMENDIEDIDHA